jgi:hypothetical protein
MFNCYFKLGQKGLEQLVDDLNRLAASRTASLASGGLS